MASQVTAIKMRKQTKQLNIYIQNKIFLNVVIGRMELTVQAKRAETYQILEKMVFTKATISLAKRSCIFFTLKIAPKEGIAPINYFDVTRQKNRARGPGASEENRQRVTPWEREHGLTDGTAQEITPPSRQGPLAIPASKDLFAVVQGLPFTLSKPPFLTRSLYFTSSGLVLPLFIAGREVR